MTSFPFSRITALAMVAALAACGGGGGGASGTSSLVPPTNPTGSLTPSSFAGAPTFDLISMLQSANDDNPAVFNAAQTGTDSPFDAAASTAPCHAKLFYTSHNVVMVLNQHTYFIMALVQELIATPPVLSNGQSKTFENTKNGVIRKLTLTDNGGGTYAYELDVAKQAETPAFVTVYSGTTTTSTSGTVTTTSGQMTFNYTNLSSVYTGFGAAGTVDATFNDVKDTSRPAGQQLKKLLTFSLNSFVKSGGNQHGPRNGSIVHLTEPGVGGYMVFQDAMVLLCPANPTQLVSNVTNAARWYMAQDGTLHGRSDGSANGGQLPAGESWVGADCYNNGVNGYWMMKVEDAKGNTLSGSATSNKTSGCDPVFGAVPDLTDNVNDFTFSAKPGFPNEW